MAKEKHAATFLGGSKSLVAIGDNHVYAFSGQVGVPNAFTTLLEYTTANTPYKVSLEFSIVSDGGTATSDDYLLTLQLNDVYAASWVTDKSATLNLLMVPVSFIIPPLTKVKIRAYNNSSSTANQVYAWMYGKRLDA